MYPTCSCCGKSNKTVTLEPSTRQLIFGGFNIRMVYRCAKCDRRLGQRLLKLGQVHDASKILNLTEFKYLRDDYLGKPEFAAALLSHQTTNLHHPEAWHGIEEMPRVYVAEMVCDWKARSGEFGSDVMAWVKKRATEKFGFSTSGRAYKEIKEFFGILLDKAF